MIDGSIWIETDLNSGTELISFWIAEHYGLKNGDAVKIYESEDVWDAVIYERESDDIEKRWYVSDIVHAGILSAAEQRAIEIGYTNGKFIERKLTEIDIARKMFHNDIPMKTIKKIVRLSDERLKIMEAEYLAV